MIKTPAYLGLLALLFCVRAWGCDPNDQRAISTYQWENYVQLRQKPEHHAWARHLPTLAPFSAHQAIKIFDWPMAYLGGRWIFYHLFGTCGELRDQTHQPLYAADDIEISTWMPNKFQLEHQSFQWDYQWFAIARTDEKFQMIAVNAVNFDQPMRLSKSHFYEAIIEYPSRFALIYKTQANHQYYGILTWQNGAFHEIIPISDFLLNRN